MVVVEVVGSRVFTWMVVSLRVVVVVSVLTGAWVRSESLLSA